MAKRLQMQDWTPLVSYLSSDVWKNLQSKEISSLGAVEIVLKHLVAMGLRAPSEATQAMIVALLVKNSDTFRYISDTFLKCIRIVSGRYQNVSEIS